MTHTYLHPTQHPNSIPAFKAQRDEHENKQTHGTCFNTGTLLATESPTCRAGQDRAEQGRASKGNMGQDWTGQHNIGQDRTGQGRRTGQDKTGQDRIGQDRKGEDRA